MSGEARKVHSLDDLLDEKKPGQLNRELEIQNAIRLELGNPEKYPDVLLFRNNCGVLQDKDGRYVRYGVGSPGGADLIGLFTLSAGFARFIAGEVKSPRGEQSDAQKRFGELIEKRGGSYSILRSVEDARTWISKLRSES